MDSRKSFKETQEILRTKSLVFLDEAGVDVAMSRQDGWAIVGETPVIEKPLKGKRFSIIGAIAENGTRAVEYVEGYVNSEIFIRFLKEKLGPKLSKGDIIVMDGPKIHRVEGVEKELAKWGASVLYLPAYSPELNPIEMAWSWIKEKLREAPPRQMKLLKQRTAAFWEEISRQFCQNWIRHAGYTPTPPTTPST